ncbi:MAG TPA: TRAP transporter substrate-binding protein [Burkholderiaceae bacterium]|nr:TRAP transporter substrate-binding protein [Burkholderiaceae bacterium]
MKRRSLLVATAISTLAVALASVPAAAQTKWDMPTGYPIGNPHTVTLSLFAKDVDTATQGKLKITVHPNGSLFKANEIMRAVETGQAQLGEILMSLLANQNPVFSLDSLPFVATGFDDSYRLWQAQRPVLERVLAKRGVKLLYAVAWPPQGIYTKRELKSAADMKGLKWRAYNPATTKIAQAVGAQPLTIQAAELSQALATGVVDSFMSSGATGVDSKVWESLTHFYTVDAWLPKNMLVVNQKDFDKLDKPTQDTLLRLAAEAEKRGWERMRAYTNESLDILRKNRMSVVAPSPQLMSDMRKIGDEMLAEWLKQAGAEGQEIIDAYRKSAPPAKK